MESRGEAAISSIEELIEEYKILEGINLNLEDTISDLREKIETYEEHMEALNDKIDLLQEQLNNIE